MVRAKYEVTRALGGGGGYSISNKPRTVFHNRRYNCKYSRAHFIMNFTSVNNIQLHV